MDRTRYSVEYGSKLFISEIFHHVRLFGDTGAVSTPSSPHLAWSLNLSINNNPSRSFTVFGEGPCQGLILVGTLDCKDWSLRGCLVRIDSSRGLFLAFWNCECTLIPLLLLATFPGQTSDLPPWPPPPRTPAQSYPLKDTKIFQSNVGSLGAMLSPNWLMVKCSWHSWWSSHCLHNFPVSFQD